jgi:hypothetical protein
MNARAIGSTVAVALVAGAFVSVFAFLLARYGPAGDSWSFRGNGELAAYTLVPALVAGGWTALVLRHRGRDDWLIWGVGALAVGLVLDVLDAALLPVAGTSVAVALGGPLLIALALWAIVAPVLAWIVVKAGSGRRTAAGASGAAAVLWLIGMVVGLVLVGFVIPAGS